MTTFRKEIHAQLSQSQSASHRDTNIKIMIYAVNISQKIHRFYTHTHTHTHTHIYTQYLYFIIYILLVIYSNVLHTYTLHIIYWGKR